MAVTLIDLETPTRHRPGEAPMFRMGRALAGRRRRELAAAVIAVLALGILAGSAVAKRAVYPRLHPVGPSTPQARYAVGADFVFTTTEDGQSVAAYSMDSGEPVWRMDARNVVSLRAVAGVLVVGVATIIRATGSGDGVARGAAEVFAVDERTGRRRWTHEGVVASGSESVPLIVVAAGTGLAAYEPVSGVPVWERKFREYSTAPVADGVPRLLVQQYATPKPGVLLLPQHLLSAVDLASGAVTALGGTDFNSAAVLGLGEPMAVISSYTDSEADRTIVEGWVPSQPGRVWQYAADPNVLRQNAWACGGRLCTSQGNLTIAIDPASGEQIWRAEAEWVNHRMMRVDGTDLLVAVRRGEKGPNTLLLDPRTGQVRRDLANWSPLGAYRGRQLALWTAASTFDTSWLGYFDASVPGGVRPLFPIGPAHRCSTTSRWLFCEALGSGGQAAALRLDAVGGMPA